MELFHYHSEGSIIYSAIAPHSTVNPDEDGVITQTEQSIVNQHSVITHTSQAVG